MSRFLSPPSTGWRILRFGAMAGTGLVIGLGCAAGSPGSPFPPTRDRWISGPEHSPHIFSTWTGVTAVRTVYDFHGNGHEIAVLERVRGPDLAGAKRGLTEKVSTEVPWPLPEYYLGNANAVLIESDEVPPGIEVRVDGFARILLQGAKVYEVDAGSYQMANHNWPNDKQLDFFPLIKVRAVRRLNAASDAKPIWESDVRFWHL